MRSSHEAGVRAALVLPDPRSNQVHSLAAPHRSSKPHHLTKITASESETVFAPLRAYLTESLRQPSEAHTIITLNLEMRKPRHREFSSY